VFVGLSGNHFISKWFTDSMDALTPVVKRVIKDTGYVINLKTTIDGNYFTEVLKYNQKSSQFVRVYGYDYDGEDTFKEIPSEALSLVLFKIIDEINGKEQNE